VGYRRTLTLEHPKKYLVYLCPEHFADEHEARERQRFEMRMEREH
jgi:hypothetical protein